jgi:hypothetical protein
MKIDLYSKTPGDIFCLRSSMNNKTNEPLFYHIATCYETFLQGFTKVDSNFKKAFIFDNQALTLGLRSKLTFDQRTVGPQFWTENKLVLMSLTFDNITRDSRLVPVEQLRDVTRLNWTGPHVRYLTKLVSAAVTRFGTQAGSGSGIKTFFSNLKKGSNKVRKFMVENTPKYIPHNIVKYAENTETVLNFDTACRLNSEWKTHFLSNECRIFSFKLVNNILGYNVIISHFVPGADRNCTFCNIVRNPDPKDENVLHLFYTCITVETLINNLF